MKANKKNLWNHHSEEIQGPVGILIAISSPVSMLLPQITEPICHAQISKKKTLKDHHLTWFKGIISQSQLLKIQSRLRFGKPQLFCPYEILFIHRMLFQVPTSSRKVRPGHFVTYGLAMLEEKSPALPQNLLRFRPFQQRETSRQLRYRWTSRNSLVPQQPPRARKRYNRA